MRFVPKNIDDFPVEQQEAIKSAAQQKANQAVCHCGNPIWAVGSALCGSAMCFTCITGEADCSEDFEVLGLHTFVHGYGQYT